MPSSIPVVARPQMIRCLCGFTTYDGFTMMCNGCARWCHAACFDITSRTDIPDNWKCWICRPRPGINKTKAVVLQTIRHTRFETELRERQLKVLALVPGLETMTSIVAESFLKLGQIKVSPEACKNLVTQCLILLLAIHRTMTPQIDRKDEILSLFRQINADLTEWGELTTVKAFIRKSDINSKIEVSRHNMDHLITMFARGATKLQLTDFPEIIQLENTRDGAQNNNSPISPSPERALPTYGQAPHGNLDVDTTDSSQLPDGIPQYRNGLYENLYKVVHQKIATSPECQTRDQFRGALRAASESLAALDVSLALSRCYQYRLTLLEICSGLGIYDSPAVRQAVQDDETCIFSILQKTFSSNDSSHKKAVLQLQGTDAENFMDLLQMALDKYQGEELGFWHDARRLLVKLSEVSGIIPTSLTIRGVALLEKEAVFGGGFADIYRAVYNNTEVALKRMRIFQRGQERRKIHRTFCKEALVWKSLQHPHVLPFLGVDSTTFSPYLCMVSPWMRHGTIIQHLSDNKGADINKLLNEVAQGLNYLHSQNVVHGDLRGGNILINDQWQACLADFGLTVMSEATLATHTSNSHGSTRWMAPELHDPESFGLNRFLRTSASDIYAFGCVCLEVYTGRAPFTDVMNDTTVMLYVVKGIRPHRPPPDASRCMSDDVWDLIVQCWRQNPTERLNIRKVIDTTEKWKYPS